MAESQTSFALDQKALPFAARIWPWLLGLAMLVVYGLTLNHWVTPASLALTAHLQGLGPNPALAGPVTFLLTWPFHFFSPERVPLAVNAFTALCAALTLALLARSVALLPHDPHAGGESSGVFQRPPMLTSVRAWLPPWVAVVMCGLQLTFWQNSLSATSGMFNLLLFAYVVRCLLEFHADPQDSWLLRGALVYGLAVANDFALMLFLPALVLALFRLKRLNLFSTDFLGRALRRSRRDRRTFKLDLRTFKLKLLWQIPGCWLAGLLVILWLPAAAHFSPALHLDFWPALRSALLAWPVPLTQIPRTYLVIAGLLPLLPFFFMAVGFGQFLGGTDRLTFFVGTFFVQLVHGFLLLVCLWIMFDPPLSPRQLGFGLTGLPWYYLGALSIGYFTGHFLMLAQIKRAPAGKPPVKTVVEPVAEIAAEPAVENETNTTRIKRRRKQKRQRQRKELRLIPAPLKRCVLAGIVALSAAAPAALVWKNLPAMAVYRTDPMGDYIGRLENALPPGGAVVFGSDSFQQLYLQSALLRDRRASGCLLVNAESLTHDPGYLDHLRQSHPEFNLDQAIPAHLNATASPQVLAAMIQNLAATHEIFWLPPVLLNAPPTKSGCFQPCGLLCQLQCDPDPPSAAGLVATNELQENEAYWQTFAEQQLPALNRQINPDKPRLGGRLSHRFLATLRYSPEANPEAVLAGAYYASALYDWGATLQKAGQLQSAGQCFDLASRLNPSESAANNHP